MFRHMVGRLPSVLLKWDQGRVHIHLLGCIVLSFEVNKTETGRMKAVMPTWKPRDQPTNQSTNQRKNRYQQKAATPACSHQGLYIRNLVALNSECIAHNFRQICPF